jgi:two-component system, response regulator RegA
MATRPRVIEYSPLSALAPRDGQPGSMVSDADLERTGPLLLVEVSPGARASLQRVLTARGFTVTGVEGVRTAEATAAGTRFDYAVIDLRLHDGDSLALVRQLRERHAAMRIVVVTDADSFASVVLALRAGADGYIPKPVGNGELVDALLDRAPALPPVPDTPLGLSRTCWEHVMRVYEQCDRNVTHTAQRLGMHRRSLQRFLGKRAPQARATPVGAGDNLPIGAAASLGLSRIRTNTFDR